MRTNFINLSLLLMVVVAAPTITRAQLQPIATRELRIGFVSPTTNYISLQAPAVTTNYTLLLPPTTGTSGQTLITNGSGTLSWSTALTPTTGWSTTGNSGTNATTNFIGTTNAVDLVLRTNNTERMRVLGGGNVGIGTASPSTRLHVLDGTTTAAAAGQAVLALAGQMIAGTVGSGPMISFRENSTGNAAAAIRAYTFGGSSTGLAFSTGWANPLDRMVINNAGLVGIGTTTPAQLLTVSNGNIYLDNTGTAGELRFREPSASGTNYTAFRAGAQAANLTYTLPTTAPTAGQLLSSDASGNLSWTSAGASGWGLTGNASTNATTNFIGTTDNVDFVVRTFNTERMRVLGGGNVTIGGALGGGTSTATPVTVTLGSTFADAPTSNKAKLRIFETPSAGSVYGLGVSASQLNYFSPFGTTHRWYIGDVLTKTLDNTGFMTLVGSTPGIGTDAATDLLLRTNSAERIRIASGGNVTIGGALGVATSTATPVTLTLGSTYADAPTSNKAKLRIFETPSAGSVYGLGVSASQLNYFSPFGTTHRWYIGDVLTKTLDNTGFMTLVGSTPGIGTDAATDLLLRTNSAERIRITSGGNVTIGGALGGGTPTATPVTVTLGSTFADAPTSNKAKLRIFEATSGYVYGFGVSAGRLNYFAPSAATHRWYLGDVEMMSLSSTAATKLTVTNGNIYLDNTGTAGELRFREPSASGANYTAFRAGAQAANLTYTLPLTAPTAGQLLSSDASGNLSWTSAAASGWGLTGNAITLGTGSYAPSLAGNTYLSSAGDRGPWIGTTNAQGLWFATGNVYRASISADGAFGMTGPLTVTNLNGGASATIPAGYDRVLIANASGQIEEVSFASFANAANTSWGLTGNAITLGTGSYAPSLAGNTYLSSAGDRGPWIGTTNTQGLWFATGNVYRASISADGAFGMTGPLTVTNLNGGASATIPAGYDRVLIANASGQIEEVSFASFANAANTSWGLTGNAITLGTGSYAPSLAGNTYLSSAGDRGPWIGTTNTQGLWFATGNVYRASISETGTFSMTGPLVITNLNSTASATIAAGYDRVIIGSNTGQIEEISFADFANRSGSGWGWRGNEITLGTGSYAPSLAGNTYLSSAGDRGPWIGTTNTQGLWFATGNVYRASISETGTFSMTGPLVITNLNSTASATIAAGYDRVIIGSNTGQIEEISFADFANRSGSGWGWRGNEITLGTGSYAPSLAGNTYLSSAGDRGPWIGTTNAQGLWFATSNVYRANIATDGTFNMSGPLVVVNQARFAAGTAAAPSVTRDTDTDNGMFFPAGNTVAFSTAGTERVRITDIGRVGIGNAAPAYVLDVTGDINSSTNVRAGGTALTSDARLKRNVEPIASALTVLTQLKPVQYEKKAAIDDTLYQWKQMGFIAQELKEILPDLVQIGADKYSTMSIDYTSLIALLTSAVQQQQSVIQDQGQRISYLTALVQLFELRLKELENKLGPSTYER